MIMDPPINCSNCGGPLILEPEEMNCRECRYSYLIDNFGVIHLKDEPYDSGETDESLLDLAEKIKSLSQERFFDESVQTKLGQKYNEFGLQNKLNLSRLDWTMLETVSGKVVLNLSSGFSGASILASKRGAKMVLAVDRDLGRLRFLAAWAQKENIKNICPIYVNTLDLALRSNSIDHCIMTGLGKKMSIKETNLGPQTVQTKVLKAIHQSLSISGTILLGIENQFALQHLLGSTPHIDELSSTAILPRKLLNIISNSIKEKPHNTYTRSYGGYKKLFIKCGFHNIKFFYPLPHYQDPGVIISSVNDKLLSDTLSQWDLPFPRNIAKLTLIGMSKINLAHWFMPYYIIQGRK